MEKTIVKVAAAPRPVGPYNQAVKAGRLVFTAGQISIDPATNKVVHDGDVTAQTHQVFANLEAVLKSAGASLGSIVKTTVYLKRMSDFAAMNAVYATYLGEASPARSTVEVSELPGGVLVEIDCIAIASNAD